MSTFFVPGVPRSKGSMRAFARGGRAIMTNDSTATAPWQAAIAWAARCSRVEILAGPVSVALAFHLPRPRSVRRELPEVKPDLDKLARCVLDALTGIAWHDDAQVVDLAAIKLYATDAPGAGVEVKVTSRGG